MPADDFYEMADARGFIIWQDFTDLPLKADDVSLGVCRKEALNLIKRLKHHPCIFIWSSGNENLMWHEEEFENRRCLARKACGGTQRAHGLRRT